MDFADKTILITGCSSGIGHCVALGLHKRGYRVIATARKTEDVEKLKAAGLESLQLDLDDSDSIKAAVKEILERTGGKLYGLFHNGAYGQPGALEDLSRDALRAQFETNFFGWHELTNLVLPVMRKQGEGRIIMNSSILGFIGLPFRGAYVSTKYAIEGMSDTLRLELGGTNIFVSLVEPGPIRSKFRENAVSHFKAHIDVDNSPHRQRYQATMTRLNKQGDAMPFTLPPEAVLKRVIHALESPRPQPRYFVTFPTYLFGTLKRLFSFRLLDRVLHKVSDK